MVWTRIESIICQVAFYSESNRLSLLLFTVNPVALVTMPYPRSMRSGGMKQVCLHAAITRLRAENSIGYGAGWTQILPLILTRVVRTRATL